MAIDSLYQVTVKQTWGSGGKPMNNVFFYSHTAGDGDWADLAASFGTAFMPALNNLQCAIVKNQSIDVVNLGVPTDFGFLPVVGAGLNVAEALPPFAALSYTMKVNTRAVRKGSKRFSGIPESVQVDGKIVDPPYQGNIDTMRIFLQQELVSADDTWLPVIVKRIKEPVIGTVPLKYTYRLPAVGDTLVLGEVVVVLTTFDVKHQVSREV